ncbi:putative flagellar radial spoke protein-like [Leishmania infantum JPCM5]|uniref:Flagellar_radial_spoke_protein-like_-_putative n=3 Tax=Leishmania donovani species complex TaxID=38574 RepID=A0A6L0XJE2_LEIIN|nr:putative flagellar radial spoke protein-like [Leishmania infantum JPCM5]CAC9507447.1 flagellar_radial_spoke_protein-like_-_putative [Leishmania infantum]CAM69627.1 putative flagellar radial spoke protein-like [Leishmania infantum JPCM5]SUZ43565.1 flagellar_radial_spoke_protein-like_-_putative [Leishmania infantum]|eukprot:XP_001466588.1 putative flagellar radial spoke protein-like [Leishmania infantum JPCM5]
MSCSPLRFFFSHCEKTPPVGTPRKRLCRLSTPLQTGNADATHVRTHTFTYTSASVLTASRYVPTEQRRRLAVTTGAATSPFRFYVFLILGVQSLVRTRSQQLSSACLPAVHRAMAGIDEHQIRQSALWGHMTQALAQVIRERPADAMDALGAASNQLLSGSAVPPMKGNMYADPRPTARAAAPVDSFTNTRWAANTNTALAPPRPPRRPRRADAEDEQEEEDASADAGADGQPQVDLADHPGALSDVVTEQQYFNMVGLGLPRVDAYRLLVGLRQLIRSEPLSTVRFWGVVTGSAYDYYVAECQVDEDRMQENAGITGEGDAEDDMEEEEEHAPVSQIADVLCTLAGGRLARRWPRPSAPAEEAGTGLNAMCYYASTSADPTTWTRLPDVSPHHITVARALRCRFTGNLDAPVHGHPRFMGCEKHYLRAQIARITSACRIAPVQTFTTEGAVPDAEEDEEETSARPPPTAVPAYAVLPPLLPQEAPDEEDAEAIAAVQAWYKGYTKGELMQAKGWSHIAPSVLNCGRVTTAPVEEEEEPADDEGDDGQGDGANASEASPPPAPEMIAPFLSDISLDAPLSYPGHSRSHLAPWTFRKAYEGEGSLTAVYVAKSLRWPGAATYAVTTAGRPGASYQMMYYGTGLKDMQGAYYAPPLPPPCFREYVEAPGEFDGQRDCTIDEELRYAPPPPRPEAEGEDEEEDDV